MSYYSNNYLTNNFRYSSSGYPRSYSAYPSRGGELDNKYSSSYSNLSSLNSNGRQVSTTGGGKNAPAYYMSTYHTSPASSSNSATIIITKKIPDYGSSSGLDSLSKTSERHRSASRDNNRGDAPATSTSPTRRYDSSTSRFNSASNYGSSGYVSTQNKQSYDEFLRSPPVHTASGGSGAASGAGAGSSSNLNSSKSIDHIANSNSGYTGGYTPSSNNNSSNRGNSGGGSGDGNGDVTASAVSNIQLSLTDDLTTQVDYCLNEVSANSLLSSRNIETFICN